MAIGLTSAPATSLVAHVVEAEAVRHRARAGDDALSLAAQIVPGFMEEHLVAPDVFSALVRAQRDARVHPRQHVAAAVVVGGVVVEGVHVNLRDGVWRRHLRFDVIKPDLKRRSTVMPAIHRVEHAERHAGLFGDDEP